MFLAIFGQFMCEISLFFHKKTGYLAHYKMTKNV
jgi:hypothetical protein